MSSISSTGSAFRPDVTPEAPEAPEPPEAAATPTAAPADATATASSAPAEAPHRSGWDKLVDKAEKEIGKAALKEIQKPQTLDQKFKIADGLAAGAKITAQVILPESDAIKKDALKKGTSDAMAAAGKSVAWGKLDGEVRLASDFKTSAGGDATVGFPGGASVGWTLVRPFTYAQDGKTKPLATAKEALLGETVDLPIDARKARALPAGTEFTLRGNVNYGLTAAEGGVNASASESADAQIAVTRLDGDKVSVTVTRTVTDQAGASATAPLGSSGVSASASATGTAGTTTVEKFTLDLTKPQAQATYDRLLRGDTGAARAVAGGGAQSGVLADPKTTQDWTGSKLAGGLAAKLSNGFGAGLSVYDEKISEKDPRLARNPSRQALSAAASAKGKTLEWRGSGGALEASFGSSVQLGGVGVGFSTNGVLDYHAVAPSLDGKGGRVLPQDLPLDATKARALAEGTEVVIHGAGGVALSGSEGVGYSVGAGPASAGATIGLKTEVKASGDVALTVTRLGGERVRVNLAVKDAESADTSIEAKAGVEIDRTKIPGGSALAGLVGAKLGDQATKAVAKELGKILSAKASAGVTLSRADRDVASYDLDLATPEGRAAYDKLLRLDTRPAETAAAAGKGAVRNGTVEEKITARTGHADVEVFGQTLYKSRAERRDRLATLVNSAGTTTIAESEFKRERKGLLKTGNIEWEAVRVTNDKTGEDERLLHLSLGELKDKWTSVDEVGRAERFAGLMGAKVTDRWVEDENPGWWDRNVNPAARGETTGKADIYFTAKAMEDIAKASHEQALAAYGAATGKLEGGQVPAWASPDASVRAQARAILESYDPFDQEKQQQARADYFRLTDGDLGVDAESWSEAQDFAKYVDRSREGEETARLKAFADLGAKRGFDFYASIGAMNELTSADIVLLNRFEIQGKKVRLVTASEGAPALPDTKAPDVIQ